MIGKTTETHVVIIDFTSMRRHYYKIKFAEADGAMTELNIHEELVVEYRLVPGKELDEETFLKLKNSQDYQKAYSYAINVLSRRIYSEKEIRNKLKRREVDNKTIDDVIAKLFEIKLLDDFIFATAYIETQLESGRKSRQRIIDELQQKGVSHSIIDQASTLFNKESELVTILNEIKKAYERYSRKDFTDFELRNKVVLSLARKGFSLSEVGKQYGFFIEDLAFEREQEVSK